MEPEILLAYLVIGSMASTLVFIGSFTSLKSFKSSKYNLKKEQDEESEGSSDEEESESITAEDAYMFPVYGSGALLSLYMIFKYLNKDYVKYILAAYFSVAESLAAAKLFTLITKHVVPKNLTPVPFRLALTQGTKNVFKAKFNYIHVANLVAACGLTGYYIWSKNWIASNVFGAAFSLSAIQLIQLDSFKTGLILLAGLFVYDIFWVFGTDVMVTVATKFDAPIKLLWPKSFTPEVAGGPLQFTLLGLGDIVMPGIFVALCLQFDRYNAIQAVKAAGKASSLEFKKLVKQPLSASFSKPYFYACLMAYVLGLTTTIFVMHTFKAAQPALLYLSPACSAAPLLVALAKGQFAEIFTFEAESDDKKKVSKGDKDSGDESEVKDSSLKSNARQRKTTKS